MVGIPEWAHKGLKLQWLKRAPNPVIVSQVVNILYFIFLILIISKGSQRAHKGLTPALLCIIKHTDLS